MNENYRYVNEKHTHTPAHTEYTFGYKTEFICEMNRPIIISQ